MIPIRLSIQNFYQIKMKSNNQDLLYLELASFIEHVSDIVFSDDQLADFVQLKPDHPDQVLRFLSQLGY